MTRRGILPIGVVVALCGVVACLDREPSVTNIPGEPPSNSDPWPNQPAAFRAFAENQAVGTKMGFFAYGEPKTGGGKQGVLFLKGLGTGHGLANAWNVQFKQQGSGPPRDADQNVTQSKLMTVGSWHRWEVLLQLNDTGQANGVFKWWIDGTLVLDYEDWTYITSSNPLGFYTFRFWPYWGGVGGENKTRDDY